MLPIVDNFERGLAAVPENEKDTPLASGMEMVYRQLVK
jgi:molecular chaperone GrpE